MKVAFFGPWIGEFGWELMAWQAWCRAKSREFDKSYVCSFPDMAALYTDFATFIPHDHEGRALDWHKEENYSKAKYDLPTDITDMFIPPKVYRTQGEFIKFGQQDPGCKVKYVIHARGINRGGKNYPIDQWEELVKALNTHDIASVGTLADHHIKGTQDLRGINLENLMWYMAGADCVIGQSSGVMHLSSLCGTPHVVWGDGRTYFNETLDVRYQKTWNPLNTPCTYIFDDDWKPDPSVVVDHAVMLSGRKINVLKMEGQKYPMPEELRSKLKEAGESNSYLITVSYKDGDRVRNFWYQRGFETGDMIPSLENIVSEIKRVHFAQTERAEQITPAETGIKQWR